MCLFFKIKEKNNRYSHLRSFCTRERVFCFSNVWLIRIRREPWAGCGPLPNVSSLLSFTPAFPSHRQDVRMSPIFTLCRRCQGGSWLARAHLQNIWIHTPCLQMYFLSTLVQDPVDWNWQILWCFSLSWTTLTQSQLLSSQRTLYGCWTECNNN